MYKASRRREYERLRLMDEEVKREKADEEFERMKEERRKRDEAKTSKNKARREKLKAKKAKKGVGTEDGGGEEMKGVQVLKEKGQSKKSKGEAVGEAEKTGGGNPTAAEGPSRLEEVGGVIIHDDD